MTVTEDFVITIEGDTNRKYKIGTDNKVEKVVITTPEECETCGGEGELLVACGGTLEIINYDPAEYPEMILECKKCHQTITIWNPSEVEIPKTCTIEDFKDCPDC